MRSNTTMKLTTLAGAVALAASSGAWAGTNEATQTFDYQTNEVGVIALTGAAPSLSISNAQVTAGQTVMLSAASSGNTWAVTSNGGADGFKLVAALSSAMKTGNRLLVTIAGPTGSTGSTGAALTAATTQVDVVTGIGSVGQSNLAITYQLEADLTNIDRTKVTDNTVIYTMVDTATGT